jgi:hypothetical protein
MKAIKAVNDDCLCLSSIPRIWDNRTILASKGITSASRNQHAWASTTGDAIERHTNKKKERKVLKERKKIYYILY